MNVQVRFDYNQSKLNKAMSTEYPISQNTYLGIKTYGFILLGSMNPIVNI